MEDSELSGWISDENPDYPFEMEISFIDMVKLSCIEFVSHEFMIADMIEIYGFKPR